LAAALQVDYTHCSGLRAQPAAWWQDVLGVVRFDRDAAPPWPAELALTEVKAPVLAGAGPDDDAGGSAGAGRSASAGGSDDAAHDDGAAEIWRLPGPMHTGQHAGVRYRHNGVLLFASLAMTEEVTAGSDGTEALRRATDAGYRRLFAALETLGFPYPLRIWNFLSSINLPSGDGERYWHFNGARQDVFLGLNRSIAGNVPAASALGVAAESPLTVYCIASARAPIALENPRQTSAWDYPTQYGPRSPTFARACIADDAARTLFISGTASIVGHESAHAGDQCEQTREVLRNIRALVDAANERIGGEPYALDRLHYKVYVRQPEHQPSIDRELRQQIGPAARVLYLQADICRHDLLVEIEAVGTPEPP
jgi:enamine deaminase RidA (YjgF/YER057c/UK114 family)